MAGPYTPSDSSVISGTDIFRTSGKFSQNFVFDRTICDVADWTGITLMGSSAIALLNTGSSALVDPNSTGFVAPDLKNTDALGWLWTLPVDIDAAEQIDFRYLYSSDQTSGSTTCTMLYQPEDTSKATATNALTTGTTALGTVFTGAAIPTTADVPAWSEWGSISAATTGVKTLIGGDDAICGLMTFAITTATTFYLYKVQARYFKKWQR